MSELKTCPFETGAFENLKQYQGQLDEDGICVAVSREALTYVLDYVERTRTSNTSAKVDMEVAEMLNKSDKQVWAEAVQEFGSPAAALAEAERIRNIIKRVTDETCPKTRDILQAPRSDAVELVKSLKSYGGHIGYCERDPCTCGFRDVYKETEQWLKKGE